MLFVLFVFFFPGRSRHPSCSGDWFPEVCSPDPSGAGAKQGRTRPAARGENPGRDAGESSPCSPASDRKSTRLNSSHGYISYAVFCLKKKKIILHISA